MSPRSGIDLPAVIQTAIEIADTRGLEEVTLSSVAQKLDIRPPSLYNHVQGLPGLRRHLAVYGLDQLAARMTKATVGRSGDDAVRAMGEAYVAFARTHPGLYESTLRAPDGNDAEWERAGAALVELVLSVLRAYGLTDEEALHTVRALRSMFHGFASLELQGGFAMKLDLDLSLRLLIDTYLAGLHASRKGRDRS